ncbi:MAG: hypothetical protein JWQ77_3945 [Jatrophihabitans sp.]|nr:hypothetical protein [Jatrophihabitans sp.]
MPSLFEPNQSTRAAVDHPLGYASAVAIGLGLMVGIVGAVTSGQIVTALLVGLVVAVVVFAFNYIAFRRGGWGERWYRDRTKSKTAA